MGNPARMIERNEKVNAERVTKVCKEVDRMIQRGEYIKVQELADRLGVSRGFLYKNPIVSRKLKEARLHQMGQTFIPAQKVVLDKANALEIERLQKENARLKSEAENWKIKCEKLEKKLDGKLLRELRRKAL